MRFRTFVCKSPAFDSYNNKKTSKQMYLLLFRGNLNKIECGNISVLNLIQKLHYLLVRTDLFDGFRGAFLSGILMFIVHLKKIQQNTSMYIATYS